MRGSDGMTQGERLLHATRRRVYQKVGREMQRAIHQAAQATDEEVTAMREAGFKRYQKVCGEACNAAGLVW